MGFEPTVGCPTHDFQSCRFGRSRTPPGLQPGQANGPAAPRLFDGGPGPGQGFSDDVPHGGAVRLPDAPVSLPGGQVGSLPGGPPDGPGRLHGGGPDHHRGQFPRRPRRGTSLPRAARGRDEMRPTSLWDVAARCWVRWPGPAQRPLVNRVRVGRQQLSAGMAGCRSQPGRRTEHRAVLSERMGRLGRHGRRSLRFPLSALPAGPIRRAQGPGPRRQGAAQRRPRRPRLARLSLQRAPRDRQDVLGAHSGQGPQLRGARRR